MKSVDALDGKLSNQASLLSDVYQFYSFIQANALDQFITLNDRFEYETLWRYPMADQLAEVSGGKNNFFETGRFDIMKKMSQIQEDITKEYEKFNPEMSSKGIRFYLNQEHMDEFFLYGIVTFGLNPYELNCENCFNPRLKNIRISFNLMDDVFDLFEYEFKITHMGTEVSIHLVNHSKCW